MSPFFEPSNYCVDFVYMKKAQQKTTLFALTTIINTYMDKRFRMLFLIRI